VHLIFRAPFDTDQHVSIPHQPGQSLGALLGTQQSAITGCLVNGVFEAHWQTYIPQDTDCCVLFVETGAIATSTIIAAIVTTVISTVLSIALSFITRALTPTQSRTEGKVEQVYGIAGLTNTTSQGTPKLLCYGRRRVYGHILSTGVEVKADGDSEMRFRILYFMGEGPVARMTDYQINDIGANQFPGLEAYTRLGGEDNATLIHADFSMLSQVWTDGRQLPLNQPIVYQTRSGRALHVVAVVYVPFLQNDSGGSAGITVQWEYASAHGGGWTVFQSPWDFGGKSQSPRFAALQINFPSAGQWLVRATLLQTTLAQDTAPVLYNVMELQSGDARYPNCALLAFRGMASSQIQSFDAMRGSAMVQGRLVKRWTGTDFETVWTDQRAWIIRDMLTDPRVGLGHRIPESLFDDTAALDVQHYWSGEAAPDTGIPRDQCDLLVNDRRPAWDWLKMLLGEGRAALIPSNGQLKLVVDRAGTPDLLYSMPGNIVEGTLSQTLGSGQGLIPNTLMLQFPDVADRYQPHLLVYRANDTESEPQRESSALTMYTLTRYEHAYWMARYSLLRQRLIQRHLLWQSPMTALVSEPLDHVMLAYETPDFSRGVSGFLGADSTASRLVLDRLVTLDAVSSYTMLVRHQATNEVEQRQINMGAQAGEWGAILLQSPLDTAPAVGDLWALGIVGRTLLPLVVESVDQERDGTYRVTGSEYQATVYDFPTDEMPPPPFDPPPDEPPAPSYGPPSAVALSGSFGGSGVIALSWTPTVLAAGDTLEKYWIMFAERFEGDVPDGLEDFEGWGYSNTESFEQLVPELRGGYFMVFAEATHGLYGPWSNLVYTTWEYAG
jgi:hypothetical protein